MRIFSSLLFKMVRYTRLNIVLIIFCLGILLFSWNRCQISRLESHRLTQIKGGRSDILKQDVDQGYSKQVQNENKKENDESTIYEEEKSVEEDNDSKKSEKYTQDATSTTYKNIDVLVNGEKTVKGYLDKDEVYIPFSFIKDYFEIDGKIVSDNFGEKLEWRHTYYEYFTPSTEVYNPSSSFLWFVNYNVERRSRVKCITGMDEVPISTQWGPQGYYYPIQIAQYGLSHYSMLVEHGTTGEEGKVIDDGEKTGNQEWATGTHNSLKYIFNDEQNSKVIYFETQESASTGISLSLSSSSNAYILSFDISFQSPGRITVLLEVDDMKEFIIVYKTTKEIMTVTRNTVTYGIGMMKGWRRITRNLLVDLQKAFGDKSKRGKNQKKTKLRLSEIQSLSLHGKGFIDNISLAETGHQAAFLASANWLLKHQDKNGGWPVPVKRKIKGFSELKPGWYSAMAQGQAMSVLTRAYHHTKKTRYLKAAERATALFHVKSHDHGILATFMNRYKWYEEYPVTPSLFVLNGFVYSLMGLYDLKMTLPGQRQKGAEDLFKQGMVSLRAMILMFDNGSGTIYDLRHLTNSAELNLARWDYHATHVNQLYWITMIDKDPFYKKVLERWKGYFKGVRAKHN